MHRWTSTWIVLPIVTSHATLSPLTMFSSHSSQGYTLVPNDDNGEPAQKRRGFRQRFTKSHPLLFVGALAIAFGMFMSLRAFSRLSPWRSCTGSHRKLSNSTGGLQSHFQLPSGDKIPSVALGVWQAGKGEVGNAVKVALASGYRHIDGAWAYRNEEEVGQAIRDSKVNRSDIWLTSKLWNNFHAPADVESALDDSLQKLGTEYLDLYIIHWPIAFKKDGNNVYDSELSDDPYPTWKKLEEMVDKGKVRNIGISNFNIRRILNLTANPLKYQPAVNQVELNFWNPQPELLKWSKENGLLLEAYSPLGSTNQVKQSLQVPEVQKIAKELDITPAQVLISWAVQRGTIVLPKSVTPSRVEENLQIAALPTELFEQLEAAAAAHTPQRVVNPSKGWGLDFDIFDDL